MSLRVSILVLLAACAAKSPRLPAAELERALRESPDKYVVVDVRSDREWNGKGGHIAGAQHLAFPSVKERAGEIQAESDQTVVLVCFTGHRSQWAMSAVTETIDNPVVDLKGGMMAWWRKKLPVEVEEAGR